MSVEFKSIPVSKQLRYTQSGSQENAHLIIALHGYGQLVEFFSKKFGHLTNTVVVCPEGTHRFYLEGTSGRVGASWMTREWREQDILENNVALEALAKHLIQELKPNKITVLGFSQGVATASRWLASTSISIDRFIAWAGVFPPDLTYPFEENNHFSDSRFAVIGSEDPYFNGTVADEMIQLYQKMGFEIKTFEGKHELNTELLRELCF